MEKEDRKRIAKANVNKYLIMEATNTLPNEMIDYEFTDEELEFLKE